MQINPVGPINYDEAVSGDVNDFAARTDSLGQPTLAAWVLDESGANVWQGHIESGGANDSSDTIILEVPQHSKVQGITLTVSNIVINSGTQFYLSDLFGNLIESRPLESFTKAFNLQPGLYSLMMGNGTVVLDYKLSLDVVATPPGLLPTLSVTPENPLFIEDEQAVTLFSGVDANTNDTGQSFTGFTFSVSGVKEGAQEVISLSGVDISLGANSNGLVSGGSYAVSTTGGGATVTVSGVSLSQADMNSLLASMAYRHSGQNPTAGARDITLLELRDNGEPGYNSTSLNITSKVVAQAVNDAPEVTTSTGALTFIEGEGAKPIDVGLTLSDIDSATLVQAVVTISGNYVSNEDALLFTNSGTTMGNISASFDTLTGTMTLTSAGASATMAEWQAALRSVAYANTSQNPSTLPRTVEYAINDGQLSSTVAARSITLVEGNAAPTFAGLDGAPIFTEGSSPVRLNSNLSITDEELVTFNNGVGDFNGASLTLSRQLGSNAEDQLSFDTEGASYSILGNILLTGGVTFANWSNAGGALNVNFGSGATTALVNEVLQTIQYANSSDNPSGSVSLNYLFSDGNTGMQGAGGAGIAQGSTSVSIIATNDDPIVTGLPLTLTVIEDFASTIDLSGIAFSDVDSGKGDVTVTLKASTGSIGLAASGAVNLSGNGSDTVTLAGTLAAVNGYLNTPANMLYTGAANAAGLAAANLTLSINDGGNSGAGGGTDIVVGKVGMDITPVNDAPVFTTAATLAVPENSLSVTTLAATDVDNLKLFYSIQGGADSALFSLDANSGALSFNTAPDFEVPTDHDKDGTYEVIVETSDGNGGATPLTLAISVTDVNESIPPAPPPAPAPIQVTPPTPQPNTPSGQPSFSETITNTGSSSGSSKLVENSGNGNEVTVTLPGSVSLINQGARSAVNNQQAQIDLIDSIGVQQPGNLGDQTSIVRQWFATSPDGMLLDIRTLILSDRGSASANTPIQINGNAGNGSASSNHLEAFVIDASALPSGNLIQLNNIDFASIVGATSISGGAGNNVVIADNADQFIVLGAGDDELHGGGGNDVIGSKGGDDLLFGDAGNDRLFGGEGNDQLNGGSGVDVARFDTVKNSVQRDQASDGSLTISSAATGVDTLTGIELLRFADQVILAKAPELVNTAVTSFDEAFYVSRYTDVAEAITQGVFANARAHFQQYGRSEGRQAGSEGNGRDNLVFDEAFYLSQHMDVAAAVNQGGFASGYAHYVQYGEREGRDPNVLFDEAGYRAANVDVASAIQQGNFASGYEHYRLFGEAENRNPSAWMDITAYKEANSDIVATGIGALNHYMQYGIGEGRIITAADEGLWG
ncbi:MAG: hypothetical protein CME80_20320 [Halomonas sp.]|mgnify:CR=1 FL=1|nr:hypothetical protein [Halomonas sp.]MBF60030.1 hypothetical protein [Halomonas sp.]|tara:strand:- start:3511 stop:7509 length:3999 start_codon:yes stop_codon:yes gene_type:complete